MKHNSAPRPIAFTGGGSAGHVLPALAVAEAVRDAGEPHVIFLGRPNSIEERLCFKARIPFAQVPSAGLRRYRSARNLGMPFVVLHGTIVAFARLLRTRPKVLFSKGSFASVPVALAAAALRIPVVVHESDHSLGLANKIVARIASRVLLSFEDTLVPASLRRKAAVVGELVRPDLAHGDGDRFRHSHCLPHDKPILLVYGGSSGAVRINSAVRTALPELLPHSSVVHIVGEGNLDPALDAVSGYLQFEFLDAEMADALWAADLVLARSGANTIAELAALKKRAILVPLPLTVSRGDQFANAERFVREHNGEVLPDEELNERLKSTVLRHLQALRQSSGEDVTPESIRNVSATIAQMLLAY